MFDLKLRGVLLTLFQPGYVFPYKLSGGYIVKLVAIGAFIYIKSDWYFASLHEIEIF